MTYQSATSSLQGLLSMTAQLTPLNDYWNIEDILAEEEKVPV